jgi:transcriptional regulator with XRE-family HTH domain
MTLGDKLRSLRSIEGSLRGFGRPMTQSEVVTAMKRELGRGLSQAYLSQIENGSRPHMTGTSRELLARFFRVYPGFLVDDPPGYSRELQSELRMADPTIDAWLYAGAEQFAADPELARTLRAIAQENDSRAALLLLGEILRTPGLAERLSEVLSPEPLAGHPPPATH